MGEDITILINHLGFALFFLTAFNFEQLLQEWDKIFEIRTAKIIILNNLSMDRHTLNNRTAILLICNKCADIL